MEKSPSISLWLLNSITLSVSGKNFFTCFTLIFSALASITGKRSGSCSMKAHLNLSVALKTVGHRFSKPYRNLTLLWLKNLCLKGAVAQKFHEVRSLLCESFTVFFPLFCNCRIVSHQFLGDPIGFLFFVEAESGIVIQEKLLEVGFGNIPRRIADSCRKSALK